jgi:hypothetical protein
MTTPNETTNLETKNDTLFDGRSVTVLFEDGNQGVVRVSQLRLSQYEKAFAKCDDEFEMLGLICGHDGAWAMTLQPESYEALLVIAQEVNAKGFFAYADRRHGQLTRKLNSLSPQILAAATQAGTLSTSSPRPRPRQA